MNADPSFTLWHWTVSWHLVALIVILVTGYLALRLPRRMTNGRLARAGQLAMGLYMVFVGLIGLAMAAICATRSPGWFDADGLCNPATLVLLSGLLLLGMSLTLVATQHVARSGVNFLFGLGWPAWLAGILSVLALCAFWFGGADAASGSDRGGALAVAIITGVVAAALLLAWISVVARHYSATVGRAVAVAAIAASQQGILLAVHAASGGRIHAGGADIVFSATILAAAAFLAGMLVEDTSAASARTEVQRPARAA